jgi:exopolyphosphatase/guanosine-5'-triphosphate,3'-diphosphate pyrophosphatase
VAERLRKMPLEERRGVSGLNPDRADIIVAGAAIVETLMEVFEIQEMQTSRLGVRDGLLMNYIDLSDHDQELYTLSARRRSVMLLGAIATSTKSTPGMWPLCRWNCSMLLTMWN